MHAVTITGLNRVSSPKPNKGGSTILAYFDCEANGFAFQGCAFVRTPRFGLTVWLPKLDTPHSIRPNVATIADGSLRAAMVRAAQAAYRALGGTDGEWMAADEETAASNAVEMRERLERRRQQEEEEVGDASGLKRFLAEDA